MELLTEKEAAKILGLSVKTLHTARFFGKGAVAGLRYYKLGKAVRYKKEDIEAWLERHVVNGEQQDMKSADTNEISEIIERYRSRITRLQDKVNAMHESIAEKKKTIKLLECCGNCVHYNGYSCQYYKASAATGSPRLQTATMTNAWQVCDRYERKSLPHITRKYAETI